MDNDFFGVYDESFDLDRDGKLDGAEFDYMMEELHGDLDDVSDEDDSYLFDDDEDDEDEEDDWDENEEDDLWDDSDDDDDCDDSDDWDGESDDY